MSEIQRYLTKDTSNPENYKSLLPEIANLLNVSVSVIERYPADIQRALCDTYTDYYHSDQITIKQALGQIIQLNSETENQIKQAKQSAPQQEQENKKLSAQAVLSREQILNSARIIAEKNQDGYSNRQAQAIKKEREIRKYNESQST